MSVSENLTFVCNALTAAYLQTTYRVSGAREPVDIRIGIRSSALDKLLEDSWVSEWAFVTASNPGSRACPERENARRNAGLEQMLREAGLPYIQGIGVPDEPGWRAEQSYLVLGITKPGAVAMAKRWGQRACVWGSLRAAPELVWVERGSVATS